jgi:general secretion pathway protein D
MRRNPDAEPTIDELVRDYMGATPPVPVDAAGQVEAPPAAGPEIIEPEMRQSSSVVRPVDLPAKKVKR